MAFTGAYAFSFSGLYNSPHPWNEASTYLSSNTKIYDRIAREKWDEQLQPSKDMIAIDWLIGMDDKDNHEKLRENLDQLSQADYLVIHSGRIYMTLARQAESYPLSSQFHPLLFNGDLGFDLAYSDFRMPNLLEYNLMPDRFDIFGLEMPEGLGYDAFSFGWADESFLVYDQPLVMIFENQKRLSADEMLELFEKPE